MAETKKLPPVKMQTNNSNLRMKILEKHIVDGIVKADKKKPGDFTAAEIVSVLARLTYQYNDISLQQQHRDYGEDEPAEPIAPMAKA